MARSGANVVAVRPGGVDLGDGTTISADVVVAAVGARPATAWLDGTLAGLISIGDVVKTRMEELETEQQRLQDYITQGG